jgi:hypothetical protein
MSKAPKTPKPAHQAFAVLYSAGGQRLCKLRQAVAKSRAEAGEFARVVKNAAGKITRVYLREKSQSNQASKTTRNAPGLWPPQIEHHPRCLTW